MPYVHPIDEIPALTAPSVEAIAQLAPSKPAAVRLFDYNHETLEPLAPLAGVRELSLVSLRGLSSLAGLEQLTSLTSLILSTPPGWDGRGKYLEVESYAPLARLQSLESLVITGVRPREVSLEPLAALPQLKALEIAHVPDLTVEHLARLAARLPHVTSRILAPYTTIEGVGSCKRCRGQQVLLNGAPKGAKKWVCPACSPASLAAHLDAWTRCQAEA